MLSKFHTVSFADFVCIVPSVKKKIIKENCCIAQRSRSLVSKLSGTRTVDETRVHTLGKNQLLYLAMERRQCNCNCIVTIQQSKYRVYKNRDKIEETHANT